MVPYSRAGAATDDGGVGPNSEGEPLLEPAFVADAPAALPPPAVVPTDSQGEPPTGASCSL